MKVIGLTGGIGAGKSTVSRILTEKYGIPIIDADQIAYQAVEPGMPALRKIVDVFGKDYLTEDGVMDREKMGQLIRKDSRAKIALEKIIHHQVENKVLDDIESHKKMETPLLIYDCPLLFETGADVICDRTVLVTVDYEQRLRRLMDRDKIDCQTALEKMAIQLSDEEKKALADDIIDNSGDVEHLKEEINRVFQIWNTIE